MSYSKFASITADLVARNGEPALALVSAAPASPVSRAHDPEGPEMPERGFAGGSAGNECALSHALVEEGYVRWRTTHGSDLAPANTPVDGGPPHRPQARKLMVAMTDAEHEALALIAAKTGLTRHHVVRNALNGYFKWLLDEYAGTCRCISILCSNAANTTAESKDRRHAASQSAFPRASKRAH